MIEIQNIHCSVGCSTSSDISTSFATYKISRIMSNTTKDYDYALTSGACCCTRPLGIRRAFCMFGTTLPTEGTGLVMRGDMDGMLANWDSKVTPPLTACCSSV